MSVEARESVRVGGAKVEKVGLQVQPAGLDSGRLRTEIVCPVVLATLIVTIETIESSKGRQVGSLVASQVPLQASASIPSVNSDEAQNQQVRASHTLPTACDLKPRAFMTWASVVSLRGNP